MRNNLHYVHLPLFPFYQDLIREPLKQIHDSKDQVMKKEKNKSPTLI